MLTRRIWDFRSTHGRAHDYFLRGCTKKGTSNAAVTAIKKSIADLPQVLQVDQLDRLSKARTSVQRNKVKRRVKQLLLRTPEHRRASAAKRPSPEELLAIGAKRRSEAKRRPELAGARIHK